MRRLLAASIALLGLAACSGSSGTTMPGGASIATVTVTPATASLAAAQTVQLIATARDSAGNAISGQTIIWSASPTSVATVTTAGLVTAVSAGTATITATAGGKSGTATITASGSTDVANIGPAGGTVTADHGRVTLVFPAGALTTSTPISVTPLAALTPPPGGYIGTVYELGPTGSQFAQPMTLTMPYSPSALPAGVGATSLTLHTQVNGAWQPILDSYVDTIAHTVTARVSHFSLWAPCSLPCYSNDGSTPSVSFYGNYGGAETIVVNAGGSVDIPVYVSEHHFVAGPATITVSGFPSGITGTGVTLQDEQGGHVHVTASANMPGGTYPFRFHISVPNGPVEEDNDNYYIQVIGQAYTFSASPLSVTIVQGGSGTSALSFVRSAFTGTLALTADGLPNGVTASFSPASVTGSSSTVTFTATPTAQIGDATVVLRAKNPTLADATVTLDLFVNPVNASGFSIAATPASVNLAPGGSASTGIVATRTGGFAGAIAYTVTGLPTGLSANIVPTSVADSVTLFVNAASSLPFGSYSVTVTGTSGATVRQATVGVGVAAQGHIAIHLDYSNCSAQAQPIWVAYLDNGSFTHDVGVGNVYDFTLSSPTGAIALVRQNSTGFTTTVTYGTQGELAAYAGYGAVTPCTAIAGKNINATAANTTRLVDVGMGANQVTIDTTGNRTITVFNVPLGPQDATAFVLDPTAPKMIFRRDQDIPNGGSLALFDFASAEAFVPASAQITGFAPTLVFVSYSNGAPGCQFTPLYSASTYGNSFYGIPAALQRAADMHQVDALGPSGTAAFGYFHTMANQALAIGSPITPLVTSAGGQFKQLNASTSLPADYQTLSLSYTDNNNHNSIDVTATTGYAGGNSVLAATPGLTSIAGYQLAWAPAGTSTYSVVANSRNLVWQAGPACSDGTRGKSAFKNGSM